jgi:hypothetical protein
MTSWIRRYAALTTLIGWTIGGGLATAQVREGQARPPSVPPRDVASSPATQPAAASAEVSGTVVAADTGRPVRRATVRLAGSAAGAFAGRPVTAGAPGGGPLTQTTDDQGVFRFRQLQAGEYTLTATKPGYLPAIYGQKRPGTSTPGTPISLAANQRLEKLSVVMPRGSVLTGTITDEAGEPAFGVQIRAMKYVVRSGARTLEQAALGVSDDRGIYRIPALTPGQYVIVAAPRDDGGMPIELASAVNFRAVEDRAGGGDVFGVTERFVARPPIPGELAADAPTSGYAPVYYPGSTLPTAATTVTLGLAEERTGLDMRLELVPLGRIAGTVTSADGRSLTGVEITLEAATQALPGIGTRAARVLADGTFAFNRVAPGQYTVKARSGGRVQIMMTPSGGAAGMRVTLTSNAVALGAGPVIGTMESGRPEESPMWATGDALVVDAVSPVNVTLVLQPALTVTGRIEFAGSSPPADLTRVRVGLTSSIGNRPGESALGQMTTGREFKIAGVVPGKYRPVVLGLPGWVPKSLEIGGRDVLDFPLDVTGDDIAGAVLTMVEHLGTLSGSLQDGAGRPTANYTVIVAPEDPRYWTPQSRRIQATRPSTDGRFRFQNLPPGTYRLVALDDVEPESWFDPEFLRQLVPASIAVTIREADTTIQDVRINR